MLKLTGAIDWSWLWVLAPLWVPLAVAGTMFVLGLAVILMMVIMQTLFG